MSQYYFKHRVSGEETGPFTREAIVRAIRELRHIDESIYKKVGQPEWKYAYEFPEFEKHHSRYIFIGEDGKESKPLQRRAMSDVLGSEVPVEVEAKVCECWKEK